MSNETPKFLIDESCDFAVVRALRGANYDVTAVVESMPAAMDHVILQTATEQGRILITEDKDFGEWIFAQSRAAAGVLLIRYPASVRRQMVQAIMELVSEHGSELKDSYVVVEPGRARVRAI